MAEPPSWQEIDRLVAEDKVQQALDLVLERLRAAREEGDEALWTHALVKAVQLRTALGGYETAVRFLRQEPWPETPRWRTVLELFYGQTLVHYLRIYGWEIGQRERMVSSEEVDLRAWTQAQILAEAHRAFLAVWRQRAAWGLESLGALAPYVEQNDYPPRIRGTLRDTVSYLWAQLLADSALWDPARSSEAERLDLAALLGDPAPADGATLADPETHPLEAMAAVLGDLEAWHLEGDRAEAALEARLARLQALRQHVDRDDERASLRQHLEARLATFPRRYPWWSMGMATLAELVRDGGEADALVRAVAIARQAREAHPDSIGGRRAASIVAAIEAPSYQLEAMAVDGPDRRSLGVQHKNLPRLHLRAYALDLDRILAAGYRGLLPSHRQVADLMVRRQPDFSWQLTLPPTADYREHRTYATPPFTVPGPYLVVASAREDFAERGNQLQALVMQISDLVLLLRDEIDGGADTAPGGAYEVTVRSGRSGEALAGAELTLLHLDYRQGSHAAAQTRTTGADGRARFALPKTRGRQYALLARHGKQRVLDTNRLYARPQPSEPRAQRTALIYTDRSIYRPGQTLHFKAVAYVQNAGGPEAPPPQRMAGAGGRFQVLPEVDFDVQLHDANGQLVASEAVSANAFGSASGSFTIPAGRLLGGWYLRTSLGGAATIAVEEYKRPTFEVVIDDPDAPLRLARPARLRGHARYHFGLPLTEGTVVWTVTREPLFPPWWRGGWWWPRPSGGPETVATGRAALDADGTFTVDFVPEADERDAGDAGAPVYRYRLNAEVTDPGGETRDASRVFTLGFVAVEAIVSSGDGGFVPAGEPIRFEVLRRDLDGTPRAGRGSYELIALEQPDETLLPAEQPLPEAPDARAATGEDARTEGDRERPRWAPGYDPAAILALWPGGASRRSGTVEHGEDGEATIALEPLAAGAYRLIYRTEDPFGAVFETRRELLVAGQARIALPALLRLERDRVPVGGVARVLVHSGLPDQPLSLEVVRDRDVLERHDLPPSPVPRVLELPVGEDDRGGLALRLVAVRDHQLMSLDARVAVPWDDRRLEISFATFRDKLRPGTEETWKVTVRGHDGAALAAGAAELLAYMYDKSLDVFAPHQPPDPFALYPLRYGAPPVRSNLGAADRAYTAGTGLFELPSYPALREDRLIFLDGYGIGGPGRGGRHGLVMMRTSKAMPESMAVEEAITVSQAAPVAMMEAADGAAPPAPSPPPEAPPERPPELRSDFAETAFWYPHLILEEDDDNGAGTGAVSFSFTVPDAVTAWNVWVHALTRDLRAGRLQKETRTVKELLVRPYLPRFLREGDRAFLAVVVNNAGEVPLAGRLDFEILDPETEEDLRPAFGLEAAAAENVPFEVAPGGSARLVFAVTAPPRVGPIAFRVIGRAGDSSDGELRPLPVLPGRMHLLQSRFAALRDAEPARTLRFEDLARDDDPTRVDQQLVVTIDGQLFTSVLAALPYLVRYPYEHTEAVLQRFVTTGIVTGLFDDFPALGRLGAKLAARETPLEPFDDDDPNRTMALEETPWLVAARGGQAPEDEDAELLRILDPRVAAATRDQALARLRQLRNADGGFPWFGGGPSSPYVTLYLLYGFSKALEFGVEVPKDLAVGAWGFLRQHYTHELAPCLAKTGCVELATFLNYVLSAYPDASWTGGVFTDDDRRAMLERSFARWREHAPLLKGQLALTLARAGRGDDARLVLDSILDSAQTTDDGGTFWAPEARAWLWYNDDVDGHAFVLRALTELDPDDPRRDGLVQWLMLDKKLNHWKSTRGTAEAIYALAHVLSRQGTLGARQEAVVTVGDRRQTFVFEGDAVLAGGDNQLVVPGAELGPASAEVTAEKTTPGLMFASATWHYSTERLPAAARGDLFAVERRFFRRRNDGEGFVLEPLAQGAELMPGDQLEVQLSIAARHAAEYVQLRDPRPAGCEPESARSGYRWEDGLGRYEEVRDSGTNFFFEWLPAGEYTLRYRLRAALGGRFKVAPATLQSVYAPEFAAFSAGATLDISDLEEVPE